MAAAGILGNENAWRRDDDDDALASFHSRESGNPAGRGRIGRQVGIPAFAGMTSPAISPDRITLEHGAILAKRRGGALPEWRQVA